MSRRRGPFVKYRCTDDCVQEGCPGHEIREVFCSSTDTYTFEIDGKSAYCFDADGFAALLEAHEKAKEIYRGEYGTSRC